MPRKRTSGSRPARSKAGHQKYTPADRDRVLIPVLIFLVSFVLGTLWWLRTQPAPTSDFKDYIDLASGLVRHHQYGYPAPTAFRPPLYPAFLAGLLWIARSYNLISLWNIGMNAFMGVLVYYLTLGLTARDRPTATAAGILTAANPAFIFFAPIFASEHLFTPLLIGSLILLTRAGPLLPRVILCGAMLGLAILTRGEGAFYLPVALLWVVRIATGNRQKAVMAACLVASCAVVIAPWYVRNAVVIGRGAGLSTSAGLNFYYGHNPERYGWYEGGAIQGLDEVTRQREGFRRGMAYLREDPARLGADIVTGTKALYSVHNLEAIHFSMYVPDYASAHGAAFRRKYPWGVQGAVEAYYIGLVLLGAASFLFARRVRRPAWLVPVGIIAMNHLCYAVVFCANPRYRFSMEPFLCILASITLAQLAVWLRRRWNARARAV